MPKKEKVGEIVTPPKQEKTQAELTLEERAKLYQYEVELLQKKFDIVQRPIITPYGPDIQLIDAIILRKEIMKEAAPEMPNGANIAKI